jgi:hypothetical protein
MVSLALAVTPSLAFELALTLAQASRLQIDGVAYVATVFVLPLLVVC